ncbi:SSS family solute:Na+ symporter [Nocardiopsis mwathae]|uniref:Sodium/proline symporter n=1 Tax=Nocardiopsis mwathae TaxID=1472723 RepID=A0A7X0D480_9ACTN|nr:sodium/proline symporter [Nocardiopsis mwathae]MBB6171002.1 SSS family solute:Na+ symporter [Nocardiopsis mwathae]
MMPVDAMGAFAAGAMAGDLPPAHAAAQAAVEPDAALLASFTLYLVLVIGIAVYATRVASGSAAGFFLGGRAMKQVVVALSAVTSGRSAWLLLGLTGLAFMTGASAVWSVVGYTLMELFLFLFAAPRLRRFTGRRGDITLTDYFVSRLGGGRGLRALIAAVIAVFMIAYVSAQFTAGGKAFAGTFGLPTATGVWITAGIVLFYTVVGGYAAVALSDVVQAVFMLFGLVVLPVIAMASIGWTPMVATLRALDPSLLDPFSLGIGALVGALAIGLGSPGNPHIIIRYMSIDDPRRLRGAAAWGTVWNVLMGWGAVSVGLVGRAVYGDVEALPGADSEQLFPFLAAEYLPAFVAGLLVAAVFAAIMSTADSQLLVGASAVVRDIYLGLIRGGRRLEEATAVRVSRWVVLAMCLLAVGLLHVPGIDDVVFWLVLFTWAGLGAAFGPPLLLSLFWKGTTAAGAAAGVITGTVTTVTWYYTLSAHMYELIPGFIASTLATWLVSLVTRKPDDTDSLMADMRPESDRRPASGNQDGTCP